MTLVSATVAPAPPSATRAGIARTLHRISMCDPAAAHRAATAIGAVLRETDASAWPELADTFSTLTNTGAPLEFAWTSRDAAVRWTAEVAPPETDDHARLRIAAERAFHTQVPWNALDVVARLQRTARLRYGAWLGIRHRAAGDEGKVYAEIPEQPLARAAEAFGLAHPVIRTAGLTARMAGILADGSVELYTRGFDADQALLRGMENSVLRRDDRLWPAVRALVSGERLPRPSGLSIVFDPAGEPVALTWFTFAKAVHADDAQTIAALAAGTASGSSRAMLAALAGGSGDDRRRCGMVGIGMAGAGEPWLQVGLRPA